MIHIGTQRECFFDDYLVDTEKTTAEMRMHEPILRGTVLTHDAPWEGDGCDYYNFFFDDAFAGVDGKHSEGVYRMYYLGWQMPSGDPNVPPPRGISVCYAESPDGIHWERPALGISEWDGNKENNIILGKEAPFTIDNFMVFRDDNPACPKEERYKGITSWYVDPEDPSHHRLFSYFSADGIHFTLGRLITDKGHFDTLNVVFWDPEAKIYRGYIRSFHDIPENGDLNAGIRDVRYIESKDFYEWSDPVLLDFGDAEDYPLYTNVIQPYYRAPQTFIGFPTRYVERPGWNGSFEELGGKEKRLQRMKLHPRYGLAITDCVFIFSHDGKKFKRYEEAFLRPAEENGRNWVYGDCYPARGFIETPSAVEGAPNEMSFYMPANHFMGIPAELQRYTLRLDGFISLYAPSKERLLVTKPFTFEGDNLYVNFSSAARGYLYFTLISNEKRYESTETFGNTVDRRIVFEEGVVSSLSGKEVTLEVRMKDADLYSIRFGE